MISLPSDIVPTLLTWLSIIKYKVACEQFKYTMQYSIKNCRTIHVRKLLVRDQSAKLGL